jgi:6-phosphogluconolactonase (cycloisomerase 2 family)
MHSIANWTKILVLLFVQLASAQVPTITTFSPTSGPIGTSVTITGTNFNTVAAANKVYFGAVKVPEGGISSATSTSLTLTVPAGATYAPITVTDTTTGLTAYSSAPFVVTFPSSRIIDTTSFAAKVDFTTGAAPYSVAISDVDGDGKPDLVVANFNSDTVSVFRNTSTSGSITASSFTSKVDFATGSLPSSVTTGDVDGDGKPDLVVSNYFGSTVSVFRNTSTSGSITSGSFASKVDFTTAAYPSSVGILDVDGDGKPDLVVVCEGSNKVSVFRNTSTSGSMTSGSFASKVDFTTGANGRGPAMSDVDGDGKPDLVVANLNSGTFSVFRNTSTSGSIAFASKVDFATGTQPQSVAIGDVDGDGKPDVVVTNSDANAVSVFRNTSVSGSITFASTVDFTTPHPFRVAVGDMDGDGKPDLVVSNGSDTISVFRNTSTSGSIAFASKVDFATGASPYGVAIGDIDGDGKPDVVVTNAGDNTVSVLRNDEENALPVQLNLFTVVSQRLNATVTWATATEADNLGFDVERRMVGNIGVADQGNFDGSAWIKLTFVQGAGTNTSKRNYSFVDQNVAAGRYAYRLKQIDRTGKSTYSPEMTVEVGMAPRVFSLDQNYPNPFNPTTTIEFTLEADGQVVLKLYDAIGREVVTLVNEDRKARYYQSVTVDGSRFGTGMYVYRLEANGKVLSRKMLLVK